MTLKLLVTLTCLEVDLLSSSVRVRLTPTCVGRLFDVETEERTYIFLGKGRPWRDLRTGNLPPRDLSTWLEGQYDICFWKDIHATQQ